VLPAGKVSCDIRVCTLIERHRLGLLCRGRSPTSVFHLYGVNTVVTKLAAFSGFLTGIRKTYDVDRAKPPCTALFRLRPRSEISSSWLREHPSTA
jgi:hypothetical protein